MPVFGYPPAHAATHASGAYDALSYLNLDDILHASRHAAGGADALAAALAAITHPAYAESLISKHHYLPFTAMPVGNYFLGAQLVDYQIEGSEFATNNTLYMSGMWVPRPFTPDLLAIKVSAQGAAGAAIRIGFYTSLADGTPGALVFDGGAVNAETTGIKSVAYTTPIPAGLYWMALLHNDNTIRVSAFYRGLWMLGMSPGGTVPALRASANQAYGALPNPAPTSLTWNFVMPWLGFRIASVP